MKKLISTLVIIVSFITIGQSQFNFGAGAQLIFDGSIFGIQGKGLYEVDDMWRGAGGLTLYLSDGPNWALDLDAQYKLLDVSDNFNLAPFAGLGLISFPSFNIGGISAGGMDIGINLGAFIDFVPSDSYHIYIEPKIVLGGSESLVVSGGILF